MTRAWATVLRLHLQAHRGPWPQAGNTVPGPPERTSPCDGVAPRGRARAPRWARLCAHAVEDMASATTWDRPVRRRSTPPSAEAAARAGGAGPIRRAPRPGRRGHRPGPERGELHAQRPGLDAGPVLDRQAHRDHRHPADASGWISRTAFWARPPQAALPPAWLEQLVARAAAPSLRSAYFPFLPRCFGVAGLMQFSAAARQARRHALEHRRRSAAPRCGRACALAFSRQPVPKYLLWPGRSGVRQRTQARGGAAQILPGPTRPPSFTRQTSPDHPREQARSGSVSSPAQIKEEETPLPASPAARDPGTASAQDRATPPPRRPRTSSSVLRSAASRGIHFGEAAFHSALVRPPHASGLTVRHGERRRAAPGRPARYRRARRPEAPRPAAPLELSAGGGRNRARRLIRRVVEGEQQPPQIPR